MYTFEEFLEHTMGFSKCLKSCRYSQAGQTFCINNEEVEGFYWFYETDKFIVDIHHFFIKKEKISTNVSLFKPYMSFCSSYIITASGETFHPYQTLTSKTLFAVDLNYTNPNFKYLIHKNFPFLSVSINYKQDMINEFIKTFNTPKNIKMSDIILENQSMIIEPLERIAKSILDCKLSSPAADIFFEAKAKEWLAIILDASINKKEMHIQIDDEKALEDVTNYIHDHYALSINQKTLEKISTMSGTKLKTLFKQKYGCTISEYIQRRRMNIAEVLLVNTQLEIKEIAQSVGYASHSKFTACFKKYKGIYPKDIKKHISQQFKLDCDCHKK